MQPKIEKEKCPIISRVYFGMTSDKSIGDPRLLEQELGEPPSKCHFMRFEVIPVSEYGGYKISRPFIMTPDKVQSMTSPNNATYRLKVPVEFTRKGNAYTQAPGNHLCLAAVKDDLLEVWGFGLIVFEGKLLKIKHKKFDTRIYKTDDGLIIPGITNGDKLLKVLSGLVDTEALKSWDNNPQNEVVPEIADGHGIVKWADPFSQRIALLTPHGSAFSFFRQVENLQFDGKKIILPKPGELVQIFGLQNPQEGSKTTFDKVATRVRLLS